MLRRNYYDFIGGPVSRQQLFQQSPEHRDASGNVLHEDIGMFLRDRINAHFKERGVPISLKYIDPSYYIRSGPASTYDRYITDQMGRHAVHAGMAGKTGMIVGFEHGRFIHVPIATVNASKKRMELGGDLWRAVLQITGQPRWGTE